MGDVTHQIAEAVDGMTTPVTASCLSGVPWEGAVLDQPARNIDPLPMNEHLYAS